MTSWRDPDGFLHLHPDPDLEQSENGPTYTAVDNLLTKLLGEFAEDPQIHKLQRNGRWYTTSISTRERFSHDSKTGVHICQYIKAGTCDDLPTLRWGRFERVWPHNLLRDVIFCGLMKNKGYLYTLGLYLLLPMMLYSLNRPTGDTSGKMLWWLRIKGLMYRYRNDKSTVRYKTIEQLNFIMENRIRKNNPGGFPEVAAIYFKNESHPVREKMKRLYARNQ